MRDVTLTHYYVDSLELVVDPGSYLVEVRYLHDLPRGSHSVSDLPDWVFQSKLAIWLMDRGASIMERAMKGDQIRKPTNDEFSSQPHLRSRVFCTKLMESSENEVII